ncbi:MAG: hypothetical protein RL213_2188 [Bacteroidota bacterium]|jgi:cell wall-associated NlpC family hydrolase
MVAICPLSVVPVRKEPSDRSELVTQLLFGDLVEITAQEGNWRQVLILEDRYTGWVDVKQLLALSDEEALLVNSVPSRLSAETVHEVRMEDGSSMHILLGSQVSAFHDRPLPLGDRSIPFEGETVTPSRPTPEGIVTCALKYLNAPYLWGGKSPFGIDCSGLTQMVFRMNGISLPRDAWQQAEKGAPVSWGDGLNTGDLAFFENQDKKVVHVGIVISGHRIIHASGQVRIDTLDEEGIVRSGDGVRTHKLCWVRRFF